MSRRGWEELSRRAATDNPEDALRELLESVDDDAGISHSPEHGICYSLRFVGAKQRAQALLERRDCRPRLGESAPFGTADRDVQRRKMLAAIAEVWAVGPDLSLGTILAVVLHDVQRVEDIEDEELAAVLDDPETHDEIRRLQKLAELGGTEPVDDELLPRSIPTKTDGNA